MLTVDQDTDWWAVWVGRHALENLTSVPKGQLKVVQHSTGNCKGKSWLDVDPHNKDRRCESVVPNEPTNLISEGGR